ncbi:hypothetical protein [Apilactobacillus kunkeei]|uniref:hypothetical protein n=1 Tax=Apilactobacillus kunkeei TaxID=148814 RepID=UPI00112A155F|nr:hypothetical protein [Apilactobacillus kunkeei]TPR53167.1 hypothetical protein DY036_06990 [Apilactobacillus kunkeei]
MIKDVIIINLIDFVKTFLPSIFVAFISGWFNFRNNKNTQEFKKEINESNKILTKEINESNEKLKEKLLKDRIQADVTALSRIKWIEEVRKISADYISALNEYYFHHNDPYKKENFMELSYRMKLYFPINFSDNMSNLKEEDKENILGLVKEVIEEAEEFLKEDVNNYSTIYDSDAVKKFIKNRHSNIGKSPFINRMFDDNFKIMMAYGTPQKEKENEIIDTTIEVISTYLKVEWDRAKNNK